ncbi:MAG: DUF1674 domain-containing protein [Hyphomicrobiaceae bacterium]
MPAPEPTIAPTEAAVEAAPTRQLTPAAQRALAEADERRRQRTAEEAARPKEVGGRGGPDPVRFGDWEKGGIAWDF